MRYRVKSLFPCDGFATLQRHLREFRAEVEDLEARGWTREGEGIAVTYGDGVIPPTFYTLECTLESPRDAPPGAGILTGGPRAP